jgi:hypothetical protein
MKKWFHFVCKLLRFHRSKVLLPDRARTYTRNNEFCAVRPNSGQTAQLEAVLIVSYKRTQKNIFSCKQDFERGHFELWNGYIGHNKQFLTSRAGSGLNTEGYGRAWALESLKILLNKLCLSHLHAQALLNKWKSQALAWAQSSPTHKVKWHNFYKNERWWRL